MEKLKQIIDEALNNAWDRSDSFLKIRARVFNAIESTQLHLPLGDVSGRSEQLCQHSWIKHPSHPKIGAMVCLKCGSELA